MPDISAQGRLHTTDAGYRPLSGIFLFSLKGKKGVLSFVAYQHVFADPNFLNTFSFSLQMLTEAAQSLGARWGSIFFRIILPNLRTALLSAI